MAATSTLPPGLSYATLFNFILGGYDEGPAAMGVIHCDGETNATLGSSSVCSVGSDMLCSTSAKYYLGMVTTGQASNPDISISLELVSSSSGDTQNIYYNDMVRIVGHHPDFEGTNWYVTADSSCTTRRALYFTPSDNLNYQTFRITTQPGQASMLGGTGLVNGSSFTFRQESSDSDWNSNYLYASDITNGWVWSLGTSIIHSTVWSAGSIYSEDCVAPSIWDQGMYYASEMSWGDPNYGDLTKADICDSKSDNECDTSKYIKQGYVPVGDGTAAANLTIPFSSQAGCAEFGCWPDGPTENCPVFCMSNWKEQTNNSEDLMTCCAGLISDSNHCHPSACPKNTQGFDIYDTGLCGGDSTCTSSCPSIMTQQCTPDNWVSTNNSKAYMNGACDSYISQAPASQARQVAYNAVKTFYEDDKNSPTSDSLFVRKSIDLCNLFPGLADDILTEVCSQYEATDLDPKKWNTPSRQSYDPDGTSLQLVCGCFLNSSEYVLDESENVTRSCNAICGLPNGIRPLDSKTGDFEVCGGTTCVISNLTFDNVNSSEGSFSLNQACAQSGDGPFLCYLGDDIDLSGSGYGNIQIQQNCDKCFIFDPNDTSQPPTEISCTSTPGPSPSPGEDVMEEIDEILGSPYLRYSLWIGAGFLILFLFVLIFAVA